MSKAVLISIKPIGVEKIANGEQTIIVKKSRPKIETPFKCYIYQSGKNLTSTVYGAEFSKSGYVIGEFVCDRISEISYIVENETGYTGFEVEPPYPFGADGLSYEDLEAYLCKSKLGRFEEGLNLVGFGWHISALKIYDEPRELGEFERACDHENDCCTCKRFSVNYACINSISRPPQSFMYVEEL